MNLNVGVPDRLASMRARSLMFENLTYFTKVNYDDLYMNVCPTITAHTRKISEESALVGHPYNT